MTHAPNNGSHCTPCGVEKHKADWGFIIGYGEFDFWVCRQCLRDMNTTFARASSQRFPKKESVA